MKRWLTTIFVILTLTAGVLAGMPLHTPSNQMMDCCDKAKSGENSSAAEAANLCCAVNCSDPSPTSPGSTHNFAPSNFTVNRSIADQVAASFPVATLPVLSLPQYSRASLTRVFQPKYIQYKSFLI